MSLQHNILQGKIFTILEHENGSESVGEENDTGRGSRIDLVVKTSASHDYYEIKIGASIRKCIRDAVAQLLEYSYWPGGNEATRMIVVSENELIPAAANYLKTFRNRFNLPIFYRHFDVNKQILGPLE